MTGEKNSAGPKNAEPTKLAERPDEPRGSRRVAAPTGKSTGSDGTVFDPGGGYAPPEAGQETVFEPNSGPALPNAEIPAALPASQGSLLAAFDEVPYNSANPLLAAAAPLLMLLGDLPMLASDRAVEPLRRHLADAIRRFERKAQDSLVAEDDARIARYVLCETADDIAGHLPGVDRGAWLQDGMLMRFFRVQTAGTGFYEALNAVLADPEPHCDLLELMHACLSLGFQGQYRERTGSREALDRVRRDVYETLRYFRQRAEPGLSPQWEGLGTTLARKPRAPLWVISATVPAIIAAAFLAARTVTAYRADAVVEQLANLEPRKAVVVRHMAFVSPVQPAPAAPASARPRPDAQLDRLRQKLAAEIAAGTLTVATRGDFIVIEIGNEVLFDSGAALVKPTFGMLARDLTGAIDGERGDVTVVGYTDSQRPGASSVYKSNFDLSLARAKAVKDILIRTIGDPSRLQIEGKGDQDPIAHNTTAEGRARNRRIDILIRREQNP